MSDDEFSINSGNPDQEECLDFGKELKCIENVLHSNREKFIGQWLGSEYTRHVQQAKANHLKLLAKLKDTVKSNKERLRKLQVERVDNQKLNDERLKNIHSLNVKVQEMQQEIDALLMKKELSEKVLQTELEELKQHERGLADVRSSTEESMKELERSYTFFKKRLGLEFKKVHGGRLQLVFTNINDENPSLPYCVCLKINADRTFTTSDFEPAIPEAQELAEKLKATNNFRSFVISVRKRFKAVAS